MIISWLFYFDLKCSEDLIYYMHDKFVFLAYLVYCYACFSLLLESLAFVFVPQVNQPTTFSNNSVYEALTEVLAPVKVECKDCSQHLEHFALVILPPYSVCHECDFDCEACIRMPIIHISNVCECCVTSLPQIQRANKCRNFVNVNLSNSTGSCERNSR